MKTSDPTESSSSGATSTDFEFEQVVSEARKVKEQLVDKQRKWYAEHQLYPFLLFRGAGIVTIVLGVTLPAVASIPETAFAQKTLVLSAMSVIVAALTGLSAFFRWERSWRGRELSKFTIDCLTAKWELELTNARLILDSKGRRAHVYQATKDLVDNVRAVSSSETEEFFSSMHFPRTDEGRQQ